MMRTERMMGDRKGLEGKSRVTLERAHFTTSRMMDFFSEKELATQTGHRVGEWPLVAVKELVDNALDACEEAGIQPRVSVDVRPCVMTVSDNGPGIPEAVIDGVLNFGARISSREAYVSPCRGAQGNALKTLVAMPYVLSGACLLVVESRGIRHEITLTVDDVRQEPRIKHSKSESDVRIGTVVRMEWPNSARSDQTSDDSQNLQFGGDDAIGTGFYRPSAWRILLEAESEIRRILDGYSWFNPHLELTLDWDGDSERYDATTSGWKKWQPSNPTDPHWYSVDDLKRLIAANIVHKDRLVREFVREFRGISASAKQKQVLESSGLSRQMLSDLLTETGDSLCEKSVQKLLSAMQQVTSPVKPAALGVIGEEHITSKCMERYSDPDSVRYKRAVGVQDGVPWVLEVCFAMLPDSDGRQVMAGVNWSPAINNPFRHLGIERGSFDAVLEELYIEEEDPVLVMVHLASAKVRYCDKGKGTIIIDPSTGNDSIGDMLIDLVKGVAKRWTKNKIQELKKENRSRSRDELFAKTINFTDVEDEILPAAYDVVSGGGKYTVDQRQMYYQCREEFRIRTGKTIKDGYFTSNILRRFMNRNPHWKITAAPRGTLSIPNTGRDTKIPCGTIAIDNYLNVCARPASTRDLLKSITCDVRWPSLAPGKRYQAVLYIEKEGFEPQLKEARIAETYNIAIISCKGQSVVAARRFVDEVCRVDGGVPLFTVHDFDEAGFEIARCLTSEPVTNDKERIAYRFRNQIKVVDFGLRLADATKYGLQPEQYNPRGLTLPNATEEEIEYLQSGWRIELNAFTAPQFIEWITSKLDEHLPRPFIPDEATLMEAYRRAFAVRIVNSDVESLVRKSIDQAEKIEIPGDLLAKVTEIVESKGVPWDLAISEVSTACLP